MNYIVFVLCSIVYAVSVNFFIVPSGLYSGGILGFAQVLRTLIQRITGFDFEFDISGLISLIINLILLMLTRKTNGKKFIINTLFCIGFQSFLLSILPVKTLVNDVLTSVIIGGILCGGSIGLLLKYGGSSGGVDIIGMHITKMSDKSVGKINLFVDVIVYILAFLLIQNTEKIIYTVIFAGICAFSIDRTHSQNINCEVTIISKNKYEELRAMILNNINRGFTYWKGNGGFTDEDSNILYIITSKYELPLLKSNVYNIDPSAFISIKHNISVLGNFEKRI